MQIGDVAAHFMGLLMETAEHYGLDRQDLMQRHGLQADSLKDPASRYELTDFMRLGRTAIRLSGEPAFGLMMGRLSRITHLHYGGLAAMTAPTLGEALNCLLRFEPLTSRCYRGHSGWHSEGQRTCIRFYSIAPYNSYTCFVVDAVLSVWARQMSWLTGRDDLIEQVEVEFESPGHHQRYRDIFGCPATFSGHCNGLWIARTALDTPLLNAAPALHEQLLAQCEYFLDKLSAHYSLSTRIKEILGPSLHGQMPTLDQVAARLGLPEWTLRRKLHEENTSFQHIVDEMRQQLAIAYMRDTRLTFSEIAYVLGFSTPGAFQRAFKRWSGKTPGDVRKGMLGYNDSE